MSGDWFTHLSLTRPCPLVPIGANPNTSLTEIQSIRSEKYSLQDLTNVTHRIIEIHIVDSPKPHFYMFRLLKG